MTVWPFIVAEVVCTEAETWGALQNGRGASLCKMHLSLQPVMPVWVILVLDLLSWHRRK